MRAELPNSVVSRMTLVLTLLLMIMISFCLNLTAYPIVKKDRQPLPSGRIADSWDTTMQGERLALPVGSKLLIVNVKNGRSEKMIAESDEAAWSPDGESLAFSHDLSGGKAYIIRSAIGLYCPGNHSLRFLENDGNADRYPAWTATGRTLAFVRLCPGEPLELKATTAEIVVLPVRDKTQTTNLQLGSTIPSVMQWRPLHHQLAYIARSSAHFAGDHIVRSRDLYLFDCKKRTTRRLTVTHDLMEYSLAWSPDGKFVAYSTGDDKVLTIRASNVRTGKTVVLVRSAALALEGIRRVASIRWSGDGKWIVFAGSQYDPGIRSNIGEIEWPRCRLRWLTSDLNSKAPRWTSDGRILFVRNQTEIWQVRPDGSGRKRLYAVGR